jgi:WD40 repeat protein
LWNTSGKLITEFKGHQDKVISASFSPDGQRLVTASNDRTARVWDTSGKLITELKGHEDYVRSASFSPDGQRLVTTTSKGTARVWDLSGRLFAELKHQDGVISASFSPDGQRLVTKSSGTVKLWRMDGLDQLLTRGCNWLKDYLATHPEEREKLHVCQKR